MKIENQVTSLELSKKLKELGFEQESLFRHLVTISGFEKIESSYHYRKKFEDVFGKVVEEYPAYTVAELGEMLPRYIKDNYENTLTMYKCDAGYHVEYSCEKQLLRFEQAETESDARAKMLIYLKENNLL